MIAILAVIASIGIQQTAFATSDNDDDDDDSTPVFKVRVVLTGVDSQTGPLVVQVTTNDDGSMEDRVDPFKNGEAGTVDLGVFNVKSFIDINDSFEVCAFSVDHDGLYECKTAINTRANPDVVYIQAPSGIDRVPEGSTVYHPQTTYYDDDGNVIPVQDNDVRQGDDSENTQKDQGSGIGVSFGEDSDHNTVNIDQRTTFADVVKELVPQAGRAIKNTAVQLLN